MAKLTIKLKQHTPLIHFQGNQDGVTIRATEFKPKLDKFLIKHVFKENFEDYKQYLSGYEGKKREEDFKDKKAFDYKVRFCNAANWRKYDITKNFPFYFNNIDKNNTDINKFVLCDSVDVEIFSFNNELLDIINKWMEKFLLVTNFGFRQNKGFGSFSISDNEKDFSNENRYFKYKTTFNKLNNKNELECYMHLFRQLNNLYKCIRSNESKNTPYIREYAYENKMIWDKKVIRDKFLYNKESTNDNIYLIKDLLGLSVHEKWNWGKGRQAFNVKKEHICSDEKYKIERMQSPIFFKPLKDENNNFNVYIGIKEVPKEFFGQKFEITKCIEKNQKKEVLDKLELATPTKFNYDKFLEFVESKDYKIKKC